MAPQVIFPVSVGLGLLLCIVVTRTYLWPVLRTLPRATALKPILLLHGFRFVGLSFVLTGVVSPDLPRAFAEPAAYGDFATAVLALLAYFTLPTSLGFLLVWLFNVVGSIDLLYAFYQGNASGMLPGQLGATYFITTVLVPLLLVTHGLVFILLLRKVPD